jgi:glutathione S-transferase
MIRPVQEHRALNTFRHLCRCALNFKTLEFRTVWVEFPDIEALCIKIGAKPTGRRVKPGHEEAGPQPLYTFPVIHDPSTDRVVSGSLEIARYLEDAYPDKPRLFPCGTSTLQAAFQAAFSGSIHPLAWLYPAVYAKLRPESRKYFRTTRETWLRKPLEDLNDENYVEKFKANLDVVDRWFPANREAGPYVMGETASYADLIIVAALSALKNLLGEENELWTGVAVWNDGRWKGLMDSLEQYARD